MAIYKLGDKIVSRDGQRKGYVIEVAPPSRGRQLYKVMYLGENEPVMVSEISIMPDYDVSDPFACCKQHVYGNMKEYCRINTSFKISNSNNNSISSLKASKTEFKPYQFIPLLKFLNSDNRRLLIADEVGLGKTIEAGHIMLELKARHELKDVLIVCPKSLEDKWKDEMESRFGLRFTIYGSSEEVTHDLATHRGIVRGIINYERLRRGMTRTKNQEKPKPNKILDFLNDKDVMLSMVVCDEAHRLRNKTQTATGVKEVLDRAQNVLFLTATPIMTSEENLFNQLQMLDEESYNDYHIFQNNLSLNQPFLEAIRGLQKERPLAEIADKLCNTEIEIRTEYGDFTDTRSYTAGEYFEEFPIFKSIVARMRSASGAGSHSLRAALQFDLNEMSVLNNIFSRTRRRDVVTDIGRIVVRQAHDMKIELYPDEREKFDEVINEYILENSFIDEEGEVKMAPGAGLALSAKKRQISSSVYGYLNSEFDLDRGIDRYAAQLDMKVEQLINLIEEVKRKGNGKLIVFCTFIKSIKYLKIRLNKRGMGCVAIYGDVKERTEAIERFKTDEGVNVLLSSQVGGEGLDLQFCDAMVNYDLPWNPMDIEQRIGRIDRFGQKSEVVNIYNFVVKDSIQEQIYDRLLMRIDIFRSSIGDLEAILDGTLLDCFGGKSFQESIKLIEKALYENRMTDEERNDLLDRISYAINLERNNLRQVEEGLTNTLTNDAYFRQEIERIRDNNAYVTEKELVAYFSMLLDSCPDLSPCVFKMIDKHVWQLSLPLSDQRLLKNFLVKNQQNTSQEDDIMFNQFIQRIDGLNDLKITFDQATAYLTPSLIFINIYHPIIIAATNYFKEHETSNKTFCFDIPSKALGGELEKGRYYLAIYRINTTRRILKELKTTGILYPVLFDVRSGNILKQETAEKLMGIAQTDAVFHTSFNNDYPSPDVVDDMSGDMTEAEETKIESMYQEIRLKEDNYRMKQTKLIRNQYETRFNRIGEMINKTQQQFADQQLSQSEFDRNIRLHMARMDNARKELDEKLEIINAPNELNIKGNLLTLNLVFVI